MNIAFIGATILAIACVIGFLLLIYLICMSTINAYKDKDMKEFCLMCFVWFIILGFTLLIIGSI